MIEERPEWHDRANCGRNGIIGDNPEVRVRIMFPTDGSVAQRSRTVCEGCPVAGQCAASAEPFGIWAGTGRRHRLLGVAPAPPRGPQPIQHGTAHAYKNRGCRCGLCKDWNHRYYIARKAGAA